MTEPLHEPSAFDTAPIYELLDTEQRAETYIHSALLQGSQLAHRTFETADEALQAGDEHVAACIRIATSIEGLGKVDMVARGEGVQVTNVQRIPSDEPGVMSFATNPTQPLVPLSMFDERKFYYRGVVCDVTEMDKNVWQVQSNIIGVESAKKSWSFTSTQFEFPLYELGLKSMIIMPSASDDVHIEVCSLEQRRQRTEALEELAQQDVEQLGFVDDVDRIHKAFSIDVNHNVQFAEVALLRKIGSKGIRFGLQGNKQADALNTALIKTIRPNRPLIIDGRLFKAGEGNKISEQHTAGFSGKVIDVISQLPTTEKNIGPTLVMMPMDDESIHYVPLTSITSLTF